METTDSEFFSTTQKFWSGTSNKNVCPPWRCPVKKCRKERGYLVGTFFEGMHLTFKEVIFLKAINKFNIRLIFEILRVGGKQQNTRK
jgi:hypothetical protein